jgi:uncharacterized membrane protein YidH (DUF202 family)
MMPRNSGAARKPLDEGMPQERTFLSWRRTALTLSIAGFALARIALESSVILAGILAMMAVVVVLTIIVSSMGKYDSARPEITGGKTTALLASATCALAITEILLVLSE